MGCGLCCSGPRVLHLTCNTILSLHANVTAVYTCPGWQARCVGWNITWTGLVLATDIRTALGHLKEWKFVVQLGESLLLICFSTKWKEGMLTISFCRCLFFWIPKYHLSLSFLCFFFIPVLVMSLHVETGASWIKWQLSSGSKRTLQPLEEILDQLLYLESLQVDSVFLPM